MIRSAAILLIGTAMNVINGMCSANAGETCSALVPYLTPLLPHFHEDERSITIGGRRFTMRQNWNENGVAGVVWDSVKRILEVLKLRKKNFSLDI